MKPLILVGGGGHCKSVIEAAESMGLAIGGDFGFARKCRRADIGLSGYRYR